MRNSAFIVIVAAVAFATACFSSSDGTGPGAECRSSTLVEMTDQLTFDAECVQIRVGDVVRWTNVSGVPHTVTADPTKAANAANVQLPQGASPFDSGGVPPGGEFEYTFTVPGRYDYVCLPHEGAGMVGTVIVEP